MSTPIACYGGPTPIRRSKADLCDEAPSSLATGRTVGARTLQPSAGSADAKPYSPPLNHEQPTIPGMPFNSYHSPPLTPFVDELPRLPKVISPTRMVAAGGRHRFHRDLGRAPSAGFGGLSHHGPTIETQAGTEPQIRFVNNLRSHPMAIDVDTHSARSVRKGPAPTALGDPSTHRRTEPSGTRRLSDVALPTGPRRGLPVHQPAARLSTLVPRPFDGDDPAEHLCGPEQALPRPRPVGHRHA